MGIPYRALTGETGGHMNVGLWSELPAEASLEVAQGALVAATLARARALFKGGAPSRVVEAGSGWGGARRAFAKAFPDAEYIGINVAADQIAAARAANSDVPRTRYVHGRVEEDATWAEVGFADLFVSVEAAFHFESKTELIARLQRRGVRALMLAEILVEDPTAVESKLLAPALRHGWSRARYDVALAAAGFHNVTFETVPGPPFAAFAHALRQIDAHTYKARGGRMALVHQLRRAFSTLADLERDGRVSYAWISAGGG